MAQPDDDTLTQSAGPLDPAWTIDPAADATVRYVDVVTTKLYGDSLYGKPRGVRIDQGLAKAKFRVPLSAETGGPLVVTTGPYSQAPAVAARYREGSGFAPSAIDAAGALSSDGTVAVIDLPGVVADLPGVHTCQFRVVDADGTERVRNEFWVYVDRGLWSSTGDTPIESGAPTTRELRSYLRDHPGANRLLGDYEFDVAELAQAVVAAVLAFNTDYPPLNSRVSTTGWPAAWRRPLTDGALAFLFDTAAAYHRRGMLPYSAGGVQLNDLSKEKDYLTVAEMYRQRYTKWIKYTRTSISMRSGFGSLGGGLFVE